MSDIYCYVNYDKFRMKFLVCIAAIFLGTVSAISVDDLLNLDADGLDDLLNSELNGGSSEDEVPPAFCSIASDVLFVIDSSASVQSWDFATIKTFVHEIASGLDIGDDLSRVSLVQFADSADSRFYFNTFSSKLDVLQAINDTPYSGGAYSDPASLQASILNHLHSDNGWRGNMQAPSAVVVIITASSLQLDPATLHSKATRVITIGVGSAVDAAELSEVATSEDDMILADNAMSLMGEIQGVLEKICDMDAPMAPAYLLSTTTMNFNKAQQFCAEKGRELVEMATYEEYIHVAEWVFENFNKPKHSGAEIWTGMAAVHTDAGRVAQLSNGQPGYTKWTKASTSNRENVVLVTSRWRADCRGCGLRIRGKYSKRTALCGNVMTSSSDWGHPDCVFPFTYNGETYTECTSVDNDGMWCATASVYSDDQWVDCTQQGKVCRDGEFQCTDDHSCISRDNVCNFHSDCLDASDEQGCCYHDEGNFRCHADSSCVPVGWRCDGDADCDDGSDEQNCGATEELDGEEETMDIGDLFGFL